MTDINAIKSRLGSISPVVMECLPAAVRRLLKEDLPFLIAEVETPRPISLDERGKDGSSRSQMRGSFSRRQVDRPSNNFSEESRQT